jgi:rare lipoprotein A (peptidoglycan hydrolase)
MRQAAKALILLLGGAGLLTSCARLIPPSSGGGHELSGLASWYGEDFHGRRTSNREIYNMFEMTAAHKTLPFGTRLMVTNLNNGKTVAVRINDRGPFVGERIIDLSYAAASMIDMVGVGVGPRRLPFPAIPSRWAHSPTRTTPASSNAGCGPNTPTWSSRRIGPRRGLITVSG